MKDIKIKTSFEDGYKKGIKKVIEDLEKLVLRNKKDYGLNCDNWSQYLRLKSLIRKLKIEVGGEREGGKR